MYSGPLNRLSVIPGRLRLRLPILADNRILAAAVDADLAAHPNVQTVRANPITGTILLHVSTATEPDDVEKWVRCAVHRQLLWVGSNPAADLPVRVVAPSVQASGGVLEWPVPLQRLWRATDRYPSLRRRAIGLSLANGLEEMVPPLLVGLSIDTATMGSTSLMAKVGFSTVASKFFGVGIISVGFWFAASLLEYWKERTVSELANRVRHDLRTDLYAHIQTLDISSVESREITEWMAVLDRDLNQIHSFIKQGSDPFFQMTGNLAVLGGALMVASPVMAGVQLAMLPPLVLAAMRLIAPIQQRYLTARRDHEQLDAMVAGNVTGMGTVVAFDAQQREAARVEMASRRFMNSAIDAGQAEAAYVPTLKAIAGGGVVTTLVWGGARVAQGQMSAGALDTIAFMQLRLLFAIARLGVGLDHYHKMAVSLERVMNTLKTQPAVQSGTARLTRSSSAPSIEFEDVVFGYDASRPVLNGLSLRCEPGQTIGLVGESGAGKSTLVKLLMRFWDAQSGAVRIDGQDVRECELRAVRQSIALVSQQITLFAGTIHENIAYGAPGASRHSVEQAARLAEAHDFIASLPQGYDSAIGFGGLSLSGGQRQRIAIARAVLSDRPILVFDEATSSLDYLTEDVVQRSLQEVTRGRTTVIVAHRLSTIRHADRIFVLDDGTVQESGTHDELLAVDGIYAGMWKVQTGERRPRRDGVVAQFGDRRRAL